MAWKDLEMDSLVENRKRSFKSQKKEEFYYLLFTSERDECVWSMPHCGRTTEKYYLTGEPSACILNKYFSE
jgi:hypothetical protein